MGSSRNQTTIAFIGGGPRAIGLLERINANVPSIAPEMDITILIYDPHPVGAGRVWRYDQSPSLKMNSLAEDVALFSDDSCAIGGPVVPGPTLAQWVEQVRNGEIPFSAPDPLVAVEIGQLGIVLVVASALAAIRRRNPIAGDRVAVAGSVIVVLAGGYWFVERVFLTGGA